MRQVYEPANTPEAHMLVHLLAQSGIAAHILGEALQGAVGELPAGNIIRLMVADKDYERARELLLQWERASPAAEPVATPGKRFRFVAALVFMAAGFAAGWAAKIALDNTRYTFADSRVSLDQNGDGRDDVTWFYRLGAEMAHRAEWDMSFDGRVDSVSEFDVMGTTTSEEIDVNFDGSFDTQSTFRSGLRTLTLTDTDGNEIPDVRTIFEAGALRREEITDHVYGHVVRIDHFGDFHLERAEIDLDRDGFLETVRAFDRFGEIVRTETRER